MLITVRGSHSLEAAPEIGALHVTVSHESTDADMARALTTKAITSLLEELDRWLGESPSPIEKPGVDPLWTNSWTPSDENNRPLPIMYQASSSVRLRFTSFERLDWATQEWATKSGVTLSRVSWLLLDETTRRLQTEAIAGALADARSRAEAMATAAGKGELSIRHMSDPGMLGSVAIDAGSSRMAMYGAAMDTGYESRPEPIAVTASVDVIFDAAEVAATGKSDDTEA